MTTPNGYDPAWIKAINGVLEDRECTARITDLNAAFWDRFIGPMIDTIDGVGEPDPQYAVAYGAVADGFSFRGPFHNPLMLPTSTERAIPMRDTASSRSPHQPIRTSSPRWAGSARKEKDENQSEAHPNCLVRPHDRG